MGVDDRNEGDGPGECPGHAWLLVEAVAAADGSYVEQVCSRCGTVTLAGPRELGGWT